ncbi:hypothetical protein YS40_110 [Thermus phage phiYS40]|uniref:hypothetical protein n=1 Tax=Thermus phage phiYS40 TaxID=407392 RepID=UPI0000E689E4|nr:hypothetical protein YS40_110 [Thermus phage phiYS40]ABJ91504.1 hypothetical protein YS40_110 [Thermus phage phiYS40]BAK53628.1 hypothetical protein YSP_110 [Thermus phage phiYS40]
MKEMKIYNIKESVNLVENLRKNFFYVLRVNNVKDFENDLVLINLFSDEYIFAHETEKLFFNYVTSRYGVFKFSELDNINPLFEPDNPVYISRYYFLTKNNTIYYVNSYSGMFKENIIYKPLLLNFSNKHTKGNIMKRDVYKIINILEENKDVANTFLEQNVDDKDLEKFINAFGPRVIKKALNTIAKENEINAEFLKSHITNVRDMVQLVVNIVEKNNESLNAVKGLVSTSEEFTKILVDKYNIMSLF